MKTISKRMIAMLIVIAMVISIAPAVFSASLTEYYTDKSGKPISTPTMSTAADVEVPDIEGYAYVSQTQETTYVYSDNHTHARYINGYPDGTVGADSSITRAEVVQMLYNLFGSYFDAYVQMVYGGDFSLLEANTEGFNDVEKGYWYYNAVLTLYDLGAIQGYPDGAFRPDAYISRAEYCKIISLVDQLTLDKTATHSFTDISRHWAAAHIDAAAGKGWLQGYPDGTFRPDRYISRAEAVTMANAVMGRVTSSTPSEFRNPYSDITNSHWAYLDVMEASDTHIAEKWHDIGSEGITGLNLVTTRYVDTEGNEIADTTAKTLGHTQSKAIDGYVYCGQATVITLVYSTYALPSVIKTASVGDIYLYHSGKQLSRCHGSMEKCYPYRRFKRLLNLIKVG